jgi:two-component system, OmpR family, alkaline phosphatase synthesis response regulator PhoP
MTSRRVLIIEDEPDIVRGLRDALGFEGYEVLATGSARDGVRLARERTPSLVILDLMLPDGNGYAVCQQIRSYDARLPILMLTARAQESDKVRGFEVGADDYVTKPFSVAELLARVRAVFRRLGHEAPEEPVHIGRCAIDLRKQTLARGRQTEPLSFYEVEVLRLLHERREQPVSRDEILERIWGLQGNPANRTVDNFIVKLRKKIEDDQRNPRHILTVYGTGYRLVP